MSDQIDSRETDYHPRLRSNLYGHEKVERQMLNAYKAGRLHHAWLLTGPKGIGKATLAYRMARYILRYPNPAAAPDNMAVEADDVVFRRVAARGHADLLTVERTFDDKTKRLKSEIGVAEARSISHFFSRTAGEGGWRVCIVDAADDLNTTAANALLKILEEPPGRALLILVSQQSPGRLLATIRSRCIKQILSPLSDDLVAKVLSEINQQQTGNAELVKLASGSPGRALDLLNSGCAKHLLNFETLVSARPPFDRSKMMQLAEQLAARGEQQTYEGFCDLLREWIMRRASSETLTGDGAGSLANAASWADLHRAVDRSIGQSNALNLDRRAVMLETLRRIEQVETAQIPA